MCYEWVHLWYTAFEEFELFGNDFEITAHSTRPTVAGPSGATNHIFIEFETDFGVFWLDESSFHELRCYPVGRNVLRGRKTGLDWRDSPSFFP